MSRESITIGGHSYNVPAPFEEGHVCSKGDADTLNQTFAEAIRNKFSAKAKLGEVTQTMVDDWAENYEFGQRRAGAPRVTDPVEKRALDIALDKVLAKLRENNWKQVKEVGKDENGQPVRGQYTREQARKLAAQKLEQHPEWRDIARAQIEQENATPDIDFDMESVTAVNGETPTEYAAG